MEDCNDKKFSTGGSRRAFVAGAVLTGLAGSMALPAGASVARATPLAGTGVRTPAQAQLRQWFEAYLAAFNRSDFDAFGRYYADDVQFAGQAATLTGRQAVIDFYRNAHGYLHEELELLTFVGAASGNNCLAELQTTLVARRDWPDMPTGAMKAGDRRQSINFVMYDIAGERFTRVRSARFSSQPGQPT